MSEQFLNQKQLARRWGLSPRTLERWRCQGRGPDYFKLVGRVSYRVSDVEAFEATQFRACVSASAVGTVRCAPPGSRQPAVIHRQAA